MRFLTEGDWRMGGSAKGRGQPLQSNQFFSIFSTCICQQSCVDQKFKKVSTDSPGLFQSFNLVLFTGMFFLYSKCLATISNPYLIESGIKSSATSPKASRNNGSCSNRSWWLLWMTNSNGRIWEINSPTLLSPCGSIWPQVWSLGLSLWACDCLFSISV